MTRQDNAYWQRLRKDKPSSLAAGMAMLCILLATVGLIIILVPGTHAEARGNPLYWLLMLPTAWWASSLAYFESKTAWTVRPALVLGPAVCATNMLWERLRGTDLTINIGVLVISIACAIFGEIAYRRSLLKLEGPAR